MEFLQGQTLQRQITTLLSDRPLDCAVAFWGLGAHKRLGTAHGLVRILCNLSMGGTNPHAIRALQRTVPVRQLDDLHAKVYIGRSEMIVSSANASTNGLGFNDSVGWMEAGYRTRDHVDVARQWFELQWQRGREVTEQDLEAAQILWERRREIARLPTFLDFMSRNSGEDILLEWVSNDDYEPNRSSLQEQVGDRAEAVAERLQNAFDCLGPDDQAALCAGRWVLQWKITNRGTVNRKTKPYWMRVESGTVLRKAGNYTGDDPTDAILAMPVTQNEPFDCTGPDFFKALCGVMERPRYDRLRDLDYPLDWYTGERRELMRLFWGDLRRALAG